MEKQILELYNSEDRVMNDAIDRVVVRLYGIRKECNARSFIFTGVGSHAGTTSVALNVAIALAEAGWKTVFVDGDLRKGTDYKRIKGDNSDCSLSGYLTDHSISVEDALNETNYDGLSYIPSGDCIENPVRLLCTERMEKLVKTLKDTYDFVIFDMPSINTVNDAEILIPETDRYILVASLNVSTKKEVMDARLELDRYSDRYAGMIVNRVEMRQYRRQIKDYDYFSRDNLEHMQKQALARKNKGAVKKEGGIR
ncbi:capsular exopolysaccharide family [Lachnospiraceae bacterium]|nr:capsular exopolysaccharide family [Lachnospiraceae bacterium]